MKTGIFLAALFLAGAVLPQTGSAATERSQNDGYAILYDLTTKERKANLVFVIKDASDKVQATTKKIAKLYGRIGDDLKSWADDDKTIDLKATRLPALETETRDAIDKAHTKQLMEDTKGKAFEHLFMILQWQSLWYGYSLTETLIDHEDNPARKKALRQHAKDLRALIDEVYSQT